MILDLAERLKHATNQSLPGSEAHKRMAFKGRSAEFNPPANSRKAGVMILIYPKENHPHILYIRRKSIDGDVHKGQISFPGGKIEESDQDDLINTAIRETHEEVGVLIPRNNIISSLTPLYIPISNFQVFPTLAYITKTPSYIIQETELDDVIEIPLEYIANESIIAQREIKTSSGFLLKDVPYYDLYGQVLWGATAMITAEFLALLKRSSPLK